MLSPNIIIPYDGTHASIPANFTRDTTLDGLYPKATADSTDPNTTGGASTHTHTSPAHSHTLNSHTHAFTLNGWSGGDFNGSTNTPNETLQDGHTHSGTSGAPSGGTTNTTAATYGAASNDPPYYTVIFIKSAAYNAIPVNGMVLKEATTRTDFSFHAASASRYLKGAATAADAGDTGGSYTNTHDLTHTHTTNTHTHSATSGTSPNQNRHKRPSGSGGFMGNHTHTFSFDGGTAPIDSYTSSLVTVETVEPAYKTLNAFVNDTAGPKLPLPGDIAMWTGTLATIPVGWVLCDGTNGTPDMRSKFLKMNASATTSSTGGSNTHTHASQSHTHTSTGTHTHTAPNQTGVGPNYDGDSTGEGRSLFSGSHTVTVTATSASYASSTTTADSSNNEPSYRTVAYIQFKFALGGAIMITLL